MSSRRVSCLGILVVVFEMCFYSIAHNVWLITACLLRLNHCNDATLSVFLIPSGFGMGPSVLFPALSSVFRTNLKRQQRTMTKGVLSLVICITYWKLLVGWLSCY